MRRRILTVRESDRRDAQIVCARLREIAPPQTLRELLEAMLGLRVSRLQLSRRGLNTIDRLAKEFQFGVSVADYKIITGTNPARGDWSDTIVQHTTLTDPIGDFLVYIASAQHDADSARLADARDDDEAFGALLHIPHCCRAFFVAIRPTQAELEPLVAVLKHSNILGECPKGANVVAQYFGRGFLSHFPCSLACKATRLETSARYSVIRQISSDFADWLAIGQGRAYLVMQTGIACFEAVKSTASRWLVREWLEELGTFPGWLRNCDQLEIGQAAEICGITDGQVMGRLNTGEAWLVAPSSEW